MSYPGGSKRRKVRKRCARCGTVSLALPGEAKCKVRKFGPRSYCCWGNLVRVRRTSPPQYAAGEATVSARGSRHRQASAKKVAAQERAAARLRTRIKRLQTALRKRQAQVRRWQREAGMTDQQVEARRQRAAKAAAVSAQVGRVRRRLRAAAGAPEAPEPLAFAAGPQEGPAGGVGRLPCSDGSALRGL